MAKQSIITNAGLELLATSSKVSGQHYWLGYYALAYVPSAWKSGQTSLPNCAPDGFALDSLPDESLSYKMQNLTVSGDMIYNVFQGDLVGTGYRRGSDGSAAGDLFGLSMYDQNIKKHYRYSLDGNGNNQLIAWENADRSKPTGSLVGAAIYKGTNGFNDGALPIPAPLFHLGGVGGVTGKFSVSNYFPDILNDATNGSSIYRHATYNYGSGEHMLYPVVSADYRGYADSLGSDETASYAHKTAGTQFDDKEIAPAVLPGISGDVTVWFSSYSTRINAVGEYTGTVADTLWKVASISNYNSYHAPVSSLGNTLNSDLASRNMSTVTKFFPISNYKVINSASGFTADKQLREVATSIALTVDIDLAPSTKANGYGESNFNYDENSNLTFFDKYADNDGEYTKTSTSFKFNRIGIYAVALNDTPYTIRRADDAELPGTICDVQFSINPDVEPVLFAVVDFDNTVYLSDTGDGLHRFRADINLNLDAAGENSIVYDSELVRDAVIFYNMYQDDALTWYQNQLIATASTQNAIMEFGLELGNLKSRLAELACCPTPNFDERYSLKNHSHGKAIRNIEDAIVAINGGLRGYDTAREGDDDGVYKNTPYALGIDSVTLGRRTYAFTDYVLVTGLDNAVYGGDSSTPNKYANADSRNKSIGSSIIGGSNSVIFNASNSLIATSSESMIECYRRASASASTLGEYNAILASSEAYINASNGFIAASKKSNIDDAIHSCIVGGDTVSINGGELNSVVLSRNSHIESSSGSTINASNSCYISGSTRSGIYGSEYVNITNVDGGYTSNETFVFGHVSQKTSPSTLTDSNNCIVLGGYDTNVDTVERLVLFGYSTTIKNSGDSLIGCNTIALHNIHNSIVHVSRGNSDATSHVEDVYGSIVVGTGHVIHNEYNKAFSNLYGILVVGSFNTVTGVSHYSHVSGNYNKVDGTKYATVSGYVNTILDSEASSIVGGYMNKIFYTATHSTILGGSNNTISTQFDSLNSAPDAIIRGYATIIGGRDCTATHYGEIAHSNGAILTNANSWFGSVDQQVNIVSELTKTLTRSSGPYRATSKHSVYMLGGVIDAWLNDPSGVNNKKVQVISVDETGEVKYAVDKPTKCDIFQYLTLDNKDMDERMVDKLGSVDVFIANGINLDRGESIAGTVKFIAHIPYSRSASLCCDMNGDKSDNTVGTDTENNSGATYSALYSITAHRDVVGRVTVSTQLIDESMAMMNLGPMEIYGIRSSIKAHSEYKAAGSGVGDVSGSWHATGLIKTDSQYTHTYPDGHTDTKDSVGGQYGGLVFSVYIDLPWDVIQHRYTSRYVFCSAVVDVVSINSGDILFPKIE